MVAHHDRADARWRHVLEAGDGQPMEQPEVKPERRPHHVLGQQPADDGGGHKVERAGDGEHGHRREAERRQPGRDRRPKHHENGVYHIVRRDHAGDARRVGPVLDDGVERHREHAATGRRAEQAEQRADAPDRAHQVKRRVPGCRTRTARKPSEAEREQRQQQRGQGDMARRDLAMQQPAGEHRTASDADREADQQQVQHRNAAVQARPRQLREFRQVCRADRPEPAQPEDAEPDRSVAVREAQQPRGLAEQVPADAQVRRVQPSGRHLERRHGAKRRCD